MTEDEASPGSTPDEELPLELPGSDQEPHLGGLGLGGAGTGEGWDQAEVEDEGDEEEDFQLELDEIGRPRVPEWVAGSEPEDLALALEVGLLRCSTARSAWGSSPGSWGSPLRVWSGPPRRWRTSSVAAA